MQIVSVQLDPNETIIAEAGAMNWMDEGIVKNQTVEYTQMAIFAAYYIMI